MRTRPSWIPVSMLFGLLALTWSCQRNAPTAPPPTLAAAPVPASGGASGGSGPAGSPGARVVVQLTEQGFIPSQIPARVGQPITLAITRKTEKTCAHEILFKGQPGKTDLPLDKEVEVTYTPAARGTVPFGCAMGMMVGGALEVR